MSVGRKHQSGTRAPRHRCWATVYETSEGYVGLAASAHGLAASTLPWAREDEARQALTTCLRGAAMRAWFDEPEWLGAADGLPPHLAAAREAFTVTGNEHYRRLACLQIDLRPHPQFTVRVLEAVRRLSPGETSTYGDEALKVGVAGGARAVGQVMASNPLAPVVPCHRVLTSGRRIGGFAGGPEMKARMLRNEGLQVDGDRVGSQTQ